MSYALAQTWSKIGCHQVFSNAFSALEAWYSRGEQIKKTVNELERLSDRELDDLGIARGDFRAIATQSSLAISN